MGCANDCGGIEYGLEFKFELCGSIKQRDTETQRFLPAFRPLCFRVSLFNRACLVGCVSI